jgi:hypothetical protein
MRPHGRARTAGERVHGRARRLGRAAAVAILRLHQRTLVIPLLIVVANLRQPLQVRRLCVLRRRAAGLRLCRLRAATPLQNFFLLLVVIVISRRRRGRGGAARRRHGPRLGAHHAQQVVVVLAAVHGAAAPPRLRGLKGAVCKQLDRAKKFPPLRFVPLFSRPPPPRGRPRANF